MKTAQDFYDQLGSARQDLFVQMLQDLASPTETVTDSLKKELKKVSKEIDRVNKEREQLTSDRHRVSEMLNQLSVFLQESPDADIILKLLRHLLFMWMTEIKTRTIEMRPEELLDRKHKLSLKLELIRQRMTVGVDLQRMLFGDRDGGRSRTDRRDTTAG